MLHVMLTGEFLVTPDINYV